MTSTIATRAVIIGNAGAPAVGRRASLATLRGGNAGDSAVTASRRTMLILFAVTMLHLVILGWLLYHPTSVPSQQPVLSFTVTMMELSSSADSLSSAASAASTPIEKSETVKSISEIKPVKRPARLKQPVQAESNPAPKTLAPVSHSTLAQTAVLAPITPAQFAAAYLQNPAPAYPPLSRRLGEQGNILLGVFVNELGKAETVNIRKSSGFERLDTAAIEAVKRWRFIAAHQGERLIASWVQVPIKFILE